MITDLRWVEREEIVKQYDAGSVTARIIKVLQAYDGHTWFDVPTVKED